MAPKSEMLEKHIQPFYNVLLYVAWDGETESILGPYPTIRHSGYISADTLLSLSGALPSLDSHNAQPFEDLPRLRVPLQALLMGIHLYGLALVHPKGVYFTFSITLYCHPALLIRFSVGLSSTSLHDVAYCYLFHIWCWGQIPLLT